MLRGFAISIIFFFNDTATTEIYTLSLHDALPIYQQKAIQDGWWVVKKYNCMGCHNVQVGQKSVLSGLPQYRSEEHTSELQSLAYLVCRLLLEKKKPRIPTD